MRSLPSSIFFSVTFRATATSASLPGSVWYHAMTIVQRHCVDRAIRPQMLGEAQTLSNAALCAIFRTFASSSACRKAVRDCFPAGHVDGNDRRVVKGVGQEKDLEIGASQ